MEELALGDKQSTEVASTIFAVIDWRNEGSPQLMTDISEAGEIASTALGKRVPDSGAEARPEPVLVFYVGFVIVVHVFGEVVLEDIERLFCKDANALISRVRWEVYVRSSRMVEESRWSVSYNEESRQIRYLGLSLASVRHVRSQRHILTNSPKRASAGRSVGGASRCWSMPSNTSTNFS